jgi:pimeloyl-ACP methyl ester carboxylesterase
MRTEELIETEDIQWVDGPPVFPFQWQRLRQWLRNALIGGFGLLVLFLLLGAAYQSIAQLADARRFPQRGRSVALGTSFPGLSLNINCTGQGSPVVVLDSGMGIPAIEWNLVQPEIATLTRVCSYDRAGYGWSDTGPMPRTSLRAAKELHALLISAGEKPPFVLVGHSFGGFNVRVYNHEYPTDVAGMVLVDSADEDQRTLMTPAMLAFVERQDRLYRITAPWRMRFGFTRTAMGLRRTLPLHVPASAFQEMRYLLLQPKFVQAVVSEATVIFPESAAEVRSAGSLGDRPLIVLTAGQIDQPPVLPKGLTQKDIDHFLDAHVKDLQVRQAHLSTRGRQIIVPDSHHMIPFERPDTIVNAVREVYKAVNSR